MHNTQNKQTIEKTQNYLVFEDPIPLNEVESPWTFDGYLETEMVTSHDDVAEDVFTDEERMDIISAYTPQELRIQLLDMVTKDVPYLQMTDQETRQLIEKILIEAEEQGTITTKSRDGICIIYGEKFLSSFSWLAEQSLLEDQPGKTNGILKWLMGSGDDRARAALDKAKMTLEDGAELKFSSGKILTETSSSRVKYLFFPVIESKEGPQESWKILKRAEAWGYNTVVTAAESLLKVSFGQLEDARKYIAKDLGMSVPPNAVYEDIPSLGQLIDEILKSGIVSPGIFIRQHQVGFDELQELDKMRSISPKAAELYDTRVASFMRYITDLNKQRISAGGESDAESERDSAIAELSRLGGNSIMGRVCKTVARELTINDQVSVDAVVRIREAIELLIHEAHQSGGALNYQYIAHDIGELLERENVIFDRGIFDKFFVED